MKKLLILFIVFGLMFNPVLIVQGLSFGDDRVVGNVTFNFANKVAGSNFTLTDNGANIYKMGAMVRAYIPAARFRYAIYDPNNTLLGYTVTGSHNGDGSFQWIEMNMNTNITLNAGTYFLAIWGNTHSIRCFSNVTQFVGGQSPYTWNASGFFPDPLISTSTSLAGLRNVLIYANYTLISTTTPENLTGAGFNASSSYVNLRWNHDLVNVDNFELQHSTDGVSFSFLALTSNLVYNHTGLVNGSLHWYRVRSTYEVGGVWYNSSFSLENIERVWYVLSGGGTTTTNKGFIWIFPLIALCVALLVVKGVKK